MTGVFLSVLKTAKVAPVFKKDSKFHYSNYHPISLLSNEEKILDVQKDYIPFSIAIILFITCSLDSYINILHLMP